MTTGAQFISLTSTFTFVFFKIAIKWSTFQVTILMLSQDKLSGITNLWQVFWILVGHSYVVDEYTDFQAFQLFSDTVVNLSAKSKVNVDDACLDAVFRCYKNKDRMLYYRGRCGLMIQRTCACTVPISSATFSSLDRERLIKTIFRPWPANYYFVNQITIFRY